MCGNMCLPLEAEINSDPLCTGGGWDSSVFSYHFFRISRDVAVKHGTSFGSSEAYVIVEAWRSEMTVSDSYLH